MIREDIDEQLAVLTLNRPDKANALTEDMLNGLTERLDHIAAGDQAAVILTGAGKVFSAGADLEAARAGLATSDAWERLSARVATMPCLTIAALNGTVAGGAMGMVLACDLRIAVTGAKFFYPVMKLGFLPQPSDGRRLSNLIGPARAKMILMAGQKIDAQEARDWGLIERITTAGQLISDAKGLAEHASLASPGHVSAIKALIPQP